MVGLDWVPASCTLPPERRPLRVAQWDALFAERLARVSRCEPLRLRLEFTSAEDAEDRVRDLVKRESDCCSLFVFAIAADQEKVVLDITVDVVHAMVLDALQARVGGLR